MVTLALPLLAALLLLGCGGSAPPPVASPPAGAPSAPDEPRATDENTGPAALLTFRDRETGSTWNMKGEAVAGPLNGKRLEQVPGYSAYWFAWSSFWPNTAVYSFGESDGAHGAAVTKPVSTRWIIGDVARDAIPPLDAPQQDQGRAAFTPAEDAVFMRDREIVIGIEIDGDARAYPVRIMNWHEIVNHTVGGRDVSVTYCPLTATGIHFDGEGIDFGNSGALYNNNLVMYDRGTNSLWSQMRTNAIQGQKAGTSLELLPVVQGTWEAWVRMHPDTKVLTRDTGFRRNYAADTYIQNGYTTNRDVYFDQQPDIDGRFHPKAMVLGLLDGYTAKAYPFEFFDERDVLNDSFRGRGIVVVYHESARMAIAYDRAVDGRTLTFDLLP